MKNRIKQTGFTLVELLVTLAVLIVTLAIGVPAYQTMVANNRLIATTNSFVTAVNMTKSEAIGRGEFVSICAKSTATTTNTCSGNTWTNGWIVYQGAGGGTIDMDDIVKIWPALQANEVLVPVKTVNYSSLVNATGKLDTTSSDVSDASGMTSILFERNGQTASSFTFDGYMVFRVSNTEMAAVQSRCLYVNRMGRIRLEKVTGTTCPDP